MGAGNKARGGLSVPEWEKKYGKKWEGDSSSSKYSDIVKAALENTPGQQKTLSLFEDTYTGKLKKEDYAQSKALYTPWFMKQIGNELEDLNAWAEGENINYERSLRRARFSMAVGGGAIGTERKNVEGEYKKDHEARLSESVRGTERKIGTKRIKQAGYQSASVDKEKGSIVDNMAAAIQEEGFSRRL